MVSFLKFVGIHSCHHQSCFCLFLDLLILAFVSIVTLLATLMTGYVHSSVFQPFLLQFPPGCVEGMLVVIIAINVGE
jgi:hypothetical protein